MVRLISVIVFCGLIISSFAQSYFSNGDAKALANDCYQLTPASDFKLGSVWYADKLDLSEDFDIEFELNFGSNNNGADGIVFVMQTVGTKALGQSGGGIGFSGFSPSLGIEFDTYQNTDYGDPSNDHIAIFRDGVVDHNGSNKLAGPVSAFPNSSNITDGENHLIRIVWDPATGKIEVWFDCVKRVTGFLDLVDEVFNGESEVFWGFTAATGGLNNLQIACLKENIVIKDSVVLCGGGSLELSARASADDTYTWSPATFLSSTTIQNPVTSATSDITYFVEYKDQCNTVVYDTIHVAVGPGVEVEAANDTFLCNGASLNIDIGNSYDSISWHDNSQNSVRSFSNSGEYIVEVFGLACTDSDTFNIETSVTPSISITGDSFFCVGDSGLLTASFNPAEAEFYWSDGILTPSRYVSQTQFYYAHAKNFCGEDRADFKATQIVFDEFTLGPDQDLCTGDTLTLTNPQFGNYSYLWSTGNTTFTEDITSAGDYWFELQLEGCSERDSIFITEVVSPFVEINDQTLCFNERVSLDPVAVNSSLYWNNSSIANQSFQLYNYEGLLKVVAKNACGADSSEAEISLIDCVCKGYFPNAITPNKDGLNDKYTPVFDCTKMLDYQIRVYNRWGEKMFESEDKTISWDGTFKEEKVAKDVYIFIATYSGIVNGEVQQFTDRGTITIVD